MIPYNVVIGWVDDHNSALILRSEVTSMGVAPSQSHKWVLIEGMVRRNLTTPSWLQEAAGGGRG